MPYCFMCKSIFRINSHLISHLNIFHDVKSISEFKCLEPGCYRVLSTFHSFKNHIVQHKNVLIENNKPDNLPVSTSKQEYSDSNIVNLPFSNEIISSKSNINSKPISVDNFIDTLRCSTVTLASKWYSNSIIPRKIIQVLFNDIRQFNNSFLSLLKDKMLEVKYDSNHTKDILLMFDQLSNPFSSISSEHLRFKTFDEIGILIRPRLVDIGCRLNDKMKAGRVIFEPKVFQMSFVPLRHVLKTILQDCNLFEVIIKFMNHLESNSNKCVSNFVQCKLWKSKLEKNSQKILLPLFLYFDDFEINNALGSHAGNNKLGAVYASLPCLPPEYSSSLENIFLACLFKSVDRLEFGNRAIFSELISELNYLEDTGIEILYDGKIKRVFFSLGLILGDNLGLHSILGFSESFMANFSCRFCKSNKSDCNHQLVQIDENLRNEVNYSTDIAINNLSLTGIKELCVFHEIQSFHVTNNYAVDIMHDILEGVCKYDIGMMLKVMVYNLNYFTIDTLNNRIESFNYGTIDIRNRPPLISNDSLKHGSIKMSASETLCFTKYLTLIIGELVPLNSELWSLYIVLKQIMDIIFDKCLKFEDIQLCKLLITEHHELYIRLFNTNLKPKFHHMIHYPLIMEQCGPLSLIWSMRFESKHKQLKDTAKSITSRKNSPYTLALKHQLNMSYRVLSSVNTINIKLGRRTLLSANTRLKYRNVEFLCSPFNILDDQIQFYSWIDFKGTIYNCNNMSVLINFSDNPNILPLFGLILSVFIITNNNIPFLVCNTYNNNYFDEHLQAYNVQLTNKLICCSVIDLHQVQPTIHCVMSNGLCFIPK